MQLPIFKDDNKNLMQMQNRWASIINPMLSNPLAQPNILENVSLATGVNVINHKLGRKMQGWFLTDITGIATIYRSAAMNDLTLTLTVSAPITANIGVF